MQTTNKLTELRSPGEILADQQVDNSHEVNEVVAAIAELLERDFKGPQLEYNLKELSIDRHVRLFPKVRTVLAEKGWNMEWILARSIEGPRTLRIWPINPPEFEALPLHPARRRL
jgi:hypothetical protein